MKEQWSISENKQFAEMEEGLQQEKQKYEKKIEYKTNCCIQCISYLRLILLFEVTLFLGWGCYMVFQIYIPKEMKNETIITPERYSPVIESLPVVQKSHPATEMPAIIVKPEIIIDKINNFLEDIKLTKDQDLRQDKVVLINIPYVTHTNTENSNVRSNNVAEISPINKLLGILSSRNLMRDKKKSSIPQKIISVQYIDNNINTEENKNSPRRTQFMEKLRNIGKAKVSSDFEKFENRNYFTVNVDRLTLESQENHASDVSNILKNVEFDVITILNPEMFADFTNTLQNSKQEFFDLTKDVTLNDRKKSLFENTDKQVNAHFESGFVICPPYESHESSDVLIKNSIKSISVSQPVTQEILEQGENGSSDNTDEKNQDKHDVSDRKNSMSVSAFGNQDYSDTSIVTVQNIVKQYLPEDLAQTEKDEEYESTENIKNSDNKWLQPTVQGSVKSSTSNVEKFRWINAPPSMVELISGDIPKSNEIHSPLSRDTDENMNIDDVIPGSQCEIIIKTGILEVKCPAIKFDEEWNFTSSRSPLTDDPEVTSFEKIFDDYLRAECSTNANDKFEAENISDKSSDKKVTAPQDGKSKMINAFELQESTSSSKISNDESPELFNTEFLDFLNSKEINQDYANYDTYYDLNERSIKQVTTVSSSISELSTSATESNREEHLFFDMSGARHQKKLKINKEQDLGVTDETSTEDLKDFSALKEKLTSLFKNEMLNIMTQYLSRSSAENDYRNDICDILRYARSMFQHPWREQYVALRKLLEHIRNSDYLDDADDSHRKKRMIDDLAWQQGTLITIFIIILIILLLVLTIFLKTINIFLI
ncbi:hypothetical protein PUN28_001895 [Cardiocondyla obscurior]|uniref:Uncharacterized protein n=1 Tax=Cardiocondyla obscurior TaxID=286306 RepID=A0AAW2GRM5_9HYME